MLALDRIASLAKKLKDRAKANNPSGKGGFENLESQPTAPGRNTRPQPTGGYTPNLRRRTNGAENDHFPTYGVGHPYLPGGLGGHGDRPEPGRPAPDLSVLAGLDLCPLLAGKRRFTAVIGGRS